MSSVTKTIHFKLPKETYERFLRLFPGHGERSNFLRLMIAYAIRMEAEKDCFLERIWEVLRGDLGNGEGDL